MGPLSNHLVVKQDDVQSSVYGTDIIAVATQLPQISLEEPWKIVSNEEISFADGKIQAFKS